MTKKRRRHTPEQIIRKLAQGNKPGAWTSRTYAAISASPSQLGIVGSFSTVE